MVQARQVGAVAVFAAVYAVLNVIPVAPLLGTSGGSLTLGNVFSPLAGMVLGPVTGGLSVLVGTFASIALGKPLVFDGVDFIPAVAAAVTAGLALRGKVVWAVTISFGLFALFSADPLSPKILDVGGVPVPYLWMHILSVVMILVVVAIQSRVPRFPRSAFVVACVFLATMNAQVAGGIMFENVLVRVNGVLAPDALPRVWRGIFAVYPLERLFFTVGGGALAVAVLRAIPSRTRAWLSGEAAATEA